MAVTKLTKTCPVCEGEFQTRNKLQRCCSHRCAMTKDQGQSFWSKVNKTEGCWLWTAAINNNGYGVIRVNGRLVKAHRYSWELVNVRIPEGLCALHRCDVPACVRPDHLWLGSQVDNMSDKVSKSRHAQGTRHGMAKLTDGKVREIRTAHGLHREIAARFGVSRATVRLIKSGKIWSHLAA